MNIKDYYINFFKEKGHQQVPSAPIIPENDPTCLFNTAGMQPLVPYLMGQPHPLGTRLVDFQKCFRLTDLDEVGDSTHHTFFEMLGNWSLGDYFKKESITWSFEFLTTVLKIPLERLAVTVFKGNDMVPRDEESALIWNTLGIPLERISFLGETDNWWGPAGETGPCGPDTEIFYWRSTDPIPKQHDPEDPRWVEIWNNVFMEYNKDEKGHFIPLEHKNVDTGMGVERVTAILEGLEDNYQTSLFKEAIAILEQISGKSYQDPVYQKAMRIIVDHLRAIVIISGDNALVKPSNTDQGYILRRLIRRAIRYAKQLEIENTTWDQDLACHFILKYASYYPELKEHQSIILEILQNEKNKFSKTLEKGLKEFERVSQNVKEIDGTTAFHLYDTYGFPIELTQEMALEKEIVVDIKGFEEKFLEHQEKSRMGASDKFKGGLSGHGEIETKYHTATHLLNVALKNVLGSQSHQMGSNITPERMRFDFPNDSKLTREQLQKIEDLVNFWIQEELPVTVCEMRKEDAIKSGAEAMFIEKYGDHVTVYTIGDVSKEVCGGPHVTNTKELGHFHIVKEEASSAGVRRIKAVLE